VSARRAPVDRGHHLSRLVHALSLRDEWVSVGLSTEPADREAAETAIKYLYGLVGARAPGFVWVPSPGAAMEVFAAQRHVVIERAVHRDRFADCPVAQRIATVSGDLRHAFDRVVMPLRRYWERREADQVRLVDDVGPTEAMRRGVSSTLAIEAAVSRPLLGTLEDAIRVPIRDELPADRRGRALAWYGQHEVWPAILDLARRIGLIRPSPIQSDQLDRWVILNRSCGWWWPLEDICVVAERPLIVRTEPIPGRRYGELRLHCENGPAIAYPDGWRIYSWHGTRIPEWVMTDPTPERIARESNVEVRRCAIERHGWDRLIGGAGFDLVGTARDPGNGDRELRLYRVPPNVWGAGIRLLVVTNGSVERDGTRRSYGLTVPSTIDHPLTAAAWTYGLPAYIYARLGRRT
jgi:hypothetical protein